MRVDFSSGILRGERDADYATSWAKTPFGMMVPARDEEGLLQVFDELRIVSEELIASVDLPGLDRVHLEEIVRSVLQGGYLARPGIKGKGDALIFALVNEALHRLAQIAREEEV